VLDFRPAALPDPWPRSAFDIVGQQHARRPIATDSVVGIADVDGLIAFDMVGGIFRADPWGRLQAERTQLPTRVTRIVQTEQAIIACTPPQDHARFSLDGGRTWGSLGFQCGQNRARTVAGKGEATFAIAGDRLRIGPLPAGAARSQPLPIEGAEAIGVLGHQILIAGGEALALSTDGGERFSHLPRPASMAFVRDIAFLGKGRILLAGDAAWDGHALMLSRDAGHTWDPAALPRRLDAIAALAVSPDGNVLVVPLDAADGAVLSVDQGEQFLPLEPHLLAEGAARWTPDGFVAGSARGALVGVSARAPSLGLQTPLRTAVYTHPQVAIGIGKSTGVFRSLDGGRQWQSVPVGDGVRLWDLTRIAGHAVMAVGDGVLWRSEDAGAHWDQRPLPSSCQARWVRFAPDGLQGMVGCLDGAVLTSDDGGRTWIVGPPPPVALRPAAWLNGKRWALGHDDALYTDESGAFELVASPVPNPVHLVAGPSGLSVLDRSGRRAIRTPDADDWRAARGALPDVRVARRHCPLGDGGALLLTERHVLRVAPDGDVQPLSESARRVRLTGDGGLLLLREDSTGLFEAR
jgi:photosystem II stability/assembly factor-like uncharacterized protein